MLDNSIQIDKVLKDLPSLDILDRKQYFPLTTLKNYNWDGYKLYDHEFDFQHICDFLQEVANTLHSQWLGGYSIFVKKGSIEYFNLPVAFDIEASSFRDPDDRSKRACMYIWQFGLNGSVIYGRYWEEFFELLKILQHYMRLSPKRFMRIYIHNLSYEFQWIRNYFQWSRIFALKERKMVEAEYEPMGLSLRCSYLLANASLAHVGDKMVTKYLVKKDVGDLDYSQIRGPQTPLTAKELKYAIDDTRVVMSFIQEKIEQDGSIINIPLTNTGYVRNHIRNICLGDKFTSQKYHQLMNSLTIQSPEEYEQNKRALMGGFTHASILHANKTLDNVGSADRTSAYLLEEVAQYYPMSRAKLIDTSNMTKEQFKGYLNRYCCIFDIEFFNLQPLIDYEHYLSISHCIAEDFTLNNGRVVSAQHLITTLTEIDFDIVNQVYSWDSMKVTNLRIYSRGYLPRPIIESVLDLYANKTSLKDVPSEVVEYMRSKNMANASFGMMLTDIVRPEYTLDNDENWVTLDAQVESQLNSYNRNFMRFQFYTWGIYVTAHARHSLWRAIFEFKQDYVYSDTDSVKGLNFEKHIPWLQTENLLVRSQLIKMCAAMEIPFSRCCPKTIKGEPKMLGAWEIERSYKKFKTCGAKRYMYIYADNDEFSFTIAGLDKTKAIPYLLSVYSNRQAIFDDFQDGMVIPPGSAGKLTHTYIDEETEGFATDYLGNSFYYHELSSVNFEKQGFIMSQTEEYLNLLKGIHENELR